MSRLPYFTWMMFLLTWLAIGFQAAEYYTDPIDKPSPTYIWPVDFIFVLFTLLELILKVCMKAAVFIATWILNTIFETTL